jgi:hypothetical protein
MNWLMNFEMVCLEDLIAQNRTPPPNITRVPAMVLPELNTILQGKETFEWIEKMRITMIKANMAKNAQQVGPNGFTNVEMGGFSDNFAYTMTDLPQPKSFLPYGKDDEYAIYTGVEVGKLGNKDMTTLIKNNETQRKELDKNIAEAYDNNRREIILNYEKQKILANSN